MYDADAIVVGAGQNGLVAANLLADAGLHVTVLEEQPQPGGAVRSAEDVTAPGYSTDLFSAFYPLGAASPVLRDLHLDAYGLNWRHAPLVLAHAFDDGRAALLSRDPEETAASLASFAPRDAETWMHLVDQWAQIGPALVDALLRPFPPVRPLARLGRRLGVADGLRLARLAVMPVRRYGQEEFAGDGARTLFAGNALHSDLSPDNAGSGFLGWLLMMLGQDVGFPVPEGGSGRITDALVQRLAARGIPVQCSAPVRRIVVRDGRAVGVQLADGSQVRARLAVLTDVSAPTLFRDLVGYDLLPARFVSDLQRFQWDSAVLKVNWALSGPIPWKAAEVSRAGTVHLGADFDGLTDFAADLSLGRIPRDPFLLLGQMTTSDPTRSPAGTESAWSYTHLPHERPLNDDEVARHVDVMETVVERVAPGFRDLIVGRYVQGPMDLESDDANLSGGAVNGGTASVHQQLVFRPVPGLSRPETPIDGLYLASASAHPGGAVHGACGANAAHAALARTRWYGRLYDAGWRTAGRTIWGR
jgi:phytoene dehydrogenase-like protein